MQQNRTSHNTHQACKVDLITNPGNIICKYGSQEANFKYREKISNQYIHNECWQTIYCIIWMERIFTWNQNWSVVFIISPHSYKQDGSSTHGLSKGLKTTLTSTSPAHPWPHPLWRSFFEPRRAGQSIASTNTSSQDSILKLPAFFLDFFCFSASLQPPPPHPS